MYGDVVLAVDGVAFGLVLFMVAAGFTVSFGAAGVLNFAHGAIFLCGGYAAASLTDGTWTGLIAAVGASAAAGAGLGLALAGLLVLVRPGVDQALATIGVATIAGFTLTWAFGAQPLQVRLPHQLTGSLSLLGRDYPLYRLWLVAVTALLGVGLVVLLHHTKAGLLVRAGANDSRLLSLHGVEPKKVMAAVVVASSVLAAVTGACAAGLWPPAPGTDHRIMLLSIVVAVAGGTGSVRGAMVCALVVGQMLTTGVAWWPSAAPMLPYVLLLLALAATAWARHRQPGRLRP